MRQAEVAARKKDSLALAKAFVLARSSLWQMMPGSSVGGASSQVLSWASARLARATELTIKSTALSYESLVEHITGVHRFAWHRDRGGRPNDAKRPRSSDRA
jgi:hypothetical protein